MTDSYADRLAEQNRHGLELLQLEAKLRRAQAEQIDPDPSRTLDKLRAAAARCAELLDELEASKRRELELEQLLDAARTLAIVLEGECDACPDEAFHDGYPYSVDVDELAAARDRHPAKGGSS